ncbi:Os12g0640550 [Oryza sativa Japonica Group]|uniref:Os12g0640550 protein n=2 Tax=Oryza sativa subsp. japonica TaxID=39947 RepID=C7J9I6_ORYSJ|nr:hypothetical protein EE612_061187 [Oryza sativa]BAH95809.1 Os12g0640550 [Oryza sativa Japonica Group]BAT18300.1 Os12g0640550 [Oryza sativa Japonica Group]|eukprot:NP_001177081.1 Os12g0640550 [Oryza sativa Japonica Group]
MKEASVSASRSSAPPMKTTTTPCDCDCDAAASTWRWRSTRMPTEHGASCSTFWLTRRKPKGRGGSMSMAPPSSSRRCLLWKGNSTSAAMASSAQMQMSLCMSVNDDSASTLRTLTAPSSPWYASSASPICFRISDTSSSTTVTPRAKR